MNITLKSKISNEIDSRLIVSLPIKSLLFIIVFYCYSLMINFSIFALKLSYNNETFFFVSWTSSFFILIFFLIINSLEDNSIKEQKTMLSITEIIYDLPNISSRKILRNAIIYLLTMIIIFLLTKCFQGISINISPQRILLILLIIDVSKSLKFDNIKLNCNNVSI